MNATEFTIKGSNPSGDDALTVITISIVFCTGGRSLITLVARVDSNPSDCSYKLFKGRGTSGELIASSDAFTIVNEVENKNFCLDHDMYTLELYDSNNNGWINPAGYYLSVDEGEMLFESGQFPSGVSSISTTFSSLLPFQIDYDDWKLFNSSADVNTSWKDINF